MLYSNIVNPLGLHEYKLILESMLLDMGWLFDVRPNVESSLIRESCKEFVYCERTSTSVDCVLVRSALTALVETDLEMLAVISEATPGTHEIQILKQFLKNAEGVKTRTQARPTSEDIETLFENYHEWVGRVYVGDSVKSVMASNPRIKFCLIRSFIKTPGFDNYALIRSNPHIVDMIYSDYIEYCKVNASIMPDADTALGHEMENHIDLVGTLVFGMNFFICQWAREQLPKYVTRDTSRGSGEDGYDILDAQFKLDAENYDFNVGKSLRQLAAVNECVLWNKRLQRPFYSIISWYQAMYLGNRTLELTAMLKRFLAGNFEVATSRSHYEQRAFEDLFDEVIFNVSRSSCMVGGVKSQLNRRVIFLPSFGSENENLETSQHFIDRMRECLSNFEYVYRNRDSISVENLYMDCGRLATTEKTNTQYTQHGLRNEAYDKIIRSFRDRYQLEFIPTNTLIHDYATLVYGINEVKRLSDSLELAGLSIMDVPVERNLNAQALAGISDISSMLMSRGLSSWKMVKKYRATTGTGARPVVLLTDSELISAIQATQRDTSIANVSSESVSGQLNDILSLNTNSAVDESQRSAIIGKYRSILQMQMDQPIYEANTTGRAKFIAQHNVKIMKVVQTPRDRILRIKLWTSLFKFSLFSFGYNYAITDSASPGIVEEALKKKIQALEQRVAVMRQQGTTSEDANRGLSEARNDLDRRAADRLRKAAKPIFAMDVFSDRSIFCDNAGKDDAKFIVNRVMSKTSNFDAVCYLVGLCTMTAYQSDMLMFHKEVRRLVELSKIGQEELQDWVGRCSKAVSMASNACMDCDKGVMSATAVDQESAKLASRKIDSVVVRYKDMQDALAAFGKRLLSGCGSAYVIGGASSYVASTGEEAPFHAMPMAYYEDYQFVRIGEGIGLRRYDELKSGKTMRPGAESVSTMPKGGASKVLTLGKNEYIIDGGVWLNPFNNSVLQGPSAEADDKFANCVYIFTEKPKSGSSDNGSASDTLDVYSMVLAALRSGVPRDVKDAFRSCDGVDEQYYTGISGLSKLVSAASILFRCTDKIQSMAHKYNTLMDTFNEYGMICKLARDGQITQDKFRKNQIELAAYSDIYQMQIMRSEVDMREIRDFIAQLSHISENLAGRAQTEVYHGFRSIGIDYAMPVTGESGYMNAYNLCIAYCCNILDSEINKNITHVLEAIDTMRALLGGLFQLQRVGVQQSMENYRRFNRCKSELLKYINTPEYRYAVMGADRGSETMRRLRERFDVDKATGVFYISDRQQYFLIMSNDPQCMDPSKFNVLCNVDGMLLIYDEALQTFYKQPLNTVSSEVIQAILRQ